MTFSGHLQSIHIQTSGFLIVAWKYFCSFSWLCISMLRWWICCGENMLRCSFMRDQLDIFYAVKFLAEENTILEAFKSMCDLNLASSISKSALLPWILSGAIRSQFDSFIPNCSFKFLIINPFFLKSLRLPAFERDRFLIKILLLVTTQFTAHSLHREIEDLRFV